jgi:hypothetical protein
VSCFPLLAAVIRFPSDSMAFSARLASAWSMMSTLRSASPSLLCVWDLSYLLGFPPLWLDFPQHKLFSIILIPLDVIDFFLVVFVVFLWMGWKPCPTFRTLPHC